MHAYVFVYLCDLYAYNASILKPSLEKDNVCKALDIVIDTY